MATFLVTGGTGQIGGFLCEELVSLNHKVVCMDFRPNTENVSKVEKQITLVTGDVTNLGELAGVVKQYSVDHVVHLAATLVMDSASHPSTAYQTNIMGTNNVMEAARLLDVPKLVFASSVAVYGMPRTERPGIADEDDPTEPPSDPYSTTKAANELMGRFYREKYGLDITCMRIASAWGPGRYWGYTGSFNDFVRRAAVGEAAALPADFSFTGQKLRWMYVKDVAKCFADTSLASRQKSYLFNLGSKEPFGARDVVGAIKSVLPDARVSLTELDAPTALSKTIAGPNGLDVDCTKLYSEIKFEPRFSLDTAMRDMVSFERARAGLAPLQGS
jgi:UDP-glucose 4-epimerase